jgi:hypothetical protein
VAFAYIYEQVMRVAAAVQRGTVDCMGSPMARGALTYESYGCGYREGLIGDIG